METSGSSRRARWPRPLLALAIAAGLALPPALAAEEFAAAAPATEAAAVEDPLIDPAARAAVKRMVDTLGAARSLSYEYDSSYDALQDDGEILEFGTRGTSTIRRPDRMRGEVRHRDGRHFRYAWDGTKVSVYDETRNIFASTPRDGDLDSLVDFLRDDVGFKLPVADLFTSDLGPLLIENVVAARYVGKANLNGVETEQVALRLRTGIDAQLWIGTGEHALPERLVLNFATADGRPQFRASFHDWEIDPRVRDSAFELEPSKGAKIVPFVLPKQRAAAAAAQEEAK